MLKAVFHLNTTLVNVKQDAIEEHTEKKYI